MSVELPHAPFQPIFDKHRRSCSRNADEILECHPTSTMSWGYIWMRSFMFCVGSHGSEHRLVAWTVTVRAAGLLDGHSRLCTQQTPTVSHGANEWTGSRVCASWSDDELVSSMMKAWAFPGDVSCWCLNMTCYKHSCRSVSWDVTCGSCTMSKSLFGYKVCGETCESGWLVFARAGIELMSLLVV